MKQKIQLLNWDSEKGNPFDYEISNHHDTISEDTQWEIIEGNKELKPIKTIRSNIHLKLLASMDLKYISLLNGIDEDKKESITYLEMIDKRKLIDIKKPIIVWFDYPFNKIIKATIYPLVRTFDKDEHSGSKRIILDYIGYLMWQISRVYADIYKNHWESVGVWGHGFDDLYLEGLEICNGNEIGLMIGS